MRLRATAAALVVLTAPLASCGSSNKSNDQKATKYTAAAAPTPAHDAAPWPAPPDPIRRTRAAGLVPEPREQLRYHVHAHLDVFVNGDPVVVPAGIGIDITDPGVQTGPGPSYGGIAQCEHPCISPLHTHDTTGILHTESQIDHPNTLGEFFIEWGVALNDRCVGGYCEPDASIQVFVNGTSYDGNPADITLEDKTEIAIVIGTPPAEIPTEFPTS
jgi:hypothetical protein